MQLKKLSLLIILISIFGCNRAVKQERFIFIDYNDVMQDLNTKGKASEYYSKLNYKAMICLDTACMVTFNKLNPDYKQTNHIDSSFMEIVAFINSNWTREMHVDFESMKYIFSDADIINRMCSYIYTNGINYNNIDSTIYIKDDNKAVFSHHYTGGTETFRAMLIKNKLKFQLVQTIKE